MKKSTIHLTTCSIGMGLLLSACVSAPPPFSVNETMAPPFEINMDASASTRLPNQSADVGATAVASDNEQANQPLFANDIIVEDSAAAETKEIVKPAPPVSPLAKTVPTIYRYTPDASNSLDAEKQLSEFCRDVAGKVYYELKQNGDKHLTARVAVVDAVPLSNLKKETEFGRLLSEYMLTDLADRGLKVTELRLGKEINILPQTGEFILSRNIGELATDAPILDYVMVSTFTNTRKTLILQGRLVGLKSGLVETSWRYTLPLNRELLGLFHTPEQPFKIAVNGLNR